MTIKVENLKSKNNRMDDYLSQHFPEISRSTSKKLILNSLALLNSKKVKPNAKVKDGDEVFIDLDEIKKFVEKHDLTAITPVKMDLKIIFEDENTILINKDPGVVVHPVYMHNEDTLMNGLTYYIINSESPFVRIRPVNRLDKDTSGIVLFSKNLDAHNFYSKQFKKREVEKIYIAIVKGDFKKYLNGKNSLTISNFIAKNPRGFTYKSTRNDDGEYAETTFYFESLLERASDVSLGNIETYSLIKVIPKTGRTHQIRVHLSEIGFPIVGDKLYNTDNFPQLLLHSKSLKMKLFGSNNFTTFETPLPESFKTLQDSTKLA